jgi:hypothetical protein
VFFKLDTSGFWWAHPTGIARIDADVDGAVVHLDPATRSESGSSFALAEHVLGALLPYASPDGQEIAGVNGLRVHAVAGNKLRLGFAGDRGSLTLRAEPGTSWWALLAEHDARVLGGGYRKLWTACNITATELHARTQFNLTYTAERDLSWLGSALLRRVGLFASAACSYSTRLWISGRELVIELDTAPEAKLDHDHFLGRLTDTALGVRLEVSERYCTCTRTRESAEGARQCVYHLRDPLRPGGLQMRFRSIEPPTTLFRRLRELGAEPAWLERVLPSETYDNGMPAFFHRSGGGR